ncbi:GNAT family N-acetyltransferase [Ktedonospora formicarum]|uniref:GNAT family N-acetyltransferase n=1 Tax=Ktedonospora formicarum TaxID=2778364 RepID=A0A8J3I357_9CHLR|nr:GNAT family N-acetyltransferase [Ktedonospora formicarum]GHO47916.1 GNAT family N-acetyltransferase [Ktedonospora formicarum]
MSLHIRPMAGDDLEEIVQLSLLAWSPVFDSFRQVLGARIFVSVYPDWKKLQQEVVEMICKDEKNVVWVSEIDSKVTGFIAYTIDNETKTGEVELLAVHPDYQNQGVGTALNKFVLNEMKERGMKIAVVGTGGDPGHAPARKSYEKAGYTGLPLVRYYQAL